jgi:hypothetical protein
MLNSQTSGGREKKLRMEGTGLTNRFKDMTIAILSSGWLNLTCKLNGAKVNPTPTPARARNPSIHAALSLDIPRPSRPSAVG